MRTVIPFENNSSASRRTFINRSHINFTDSFDIFHSNSAFNTNSETNSVELEILNSFQLVVLKEKNEI